MKKFNVSISITIAVILLAAASGCNNRNTAGETAECSSSSATVYEAIDSLTVNPAYSRKLIENEISNAGDDSLCYYELLYYLSLSYYTSNQYDSAYILGKEILRYTGRQPASERVLRLTSHTYNTVGNYYSWMSMTDSAIYFYGLALDSYLKTNDRAKVPDLCINIADIYMKQGDFATGVSYYRRALLVSDSLETLNKTGFPILCGLSQAYMELRDFDLAELYFQQAELMYDGQALTDRFLFSNLRGNYYYYKKEYGKAIPWFKKARALVTPKGYNFSINLANANLADVYFYLGNTDSAKYYLDLAEDYFSGINNKTTLFYIATIRAGIALRENNPAAALRYLEKEKEEAGIEPNTIMIRNQTMEDYYHQTGNYRKAYGYLSKNKAMNDSIRSEQTKMRIAELDFRYRQDTTLIKKEMLIKGQTADIKRLQLTSVLWILVCLLLLSITLFVYFNMQKKKKIQWMTFYDQLMKLKLINIRNRISPHFIFNVLNREISSPDDSERKNLTGLITLLRKSLEMTEETNVSLFDELEFVKSYIHLEKASLEPLFDLEWSVDHDINLKEKHVPPMIIQIPIENAIKHALRGKKGEKKLSIRISGKDNGIRVCIQDNGPGYSAGHLQTEHDTGTGLKVLLQTIYLFNSKNRGKMIFNITHSDEKMYGGAKVIIFIPDNYSFN
jgi:tetratricopeptide (TPR) repeat protein